MNRNINLYTWYYAATSFLAWMPVFFLYFSERLSLSEVLQLEAIYYIAVVILEVPSGYFSDRIGRKMTLLIGSIFLCSAIVFYMLGNNFSLLCVGQLLFAAHMAFVSGTNTVFHFESLKSAGVANEYGTREAQVNKWALISGGLGALLGGWLGGFDLVYAYWLSLVVAFGSFVITILFYEPQDGKIDQASGNFLIQLIKSTSFLKNPNIGWLFGLYAVMYVMVHVPYEFYQSYLSLLEHSRLLNYSSAPMMSGVLYAIAMFVGAYSAGQSIKWKNTLGMKPFLFLMLAIMILIIGLMSITLHSYLIVVIMMRSFAWSAVKAPIFEKLTPQIDAGQRATFHSLMSLVSRLGFFALLFGLSLMIPSEGAATWPELSLILKVCLGVGIIGALPLILTSRQRLIK
ncbi:MAG: MFS transporter [Saprospiraceae bacterium]